MKKEEKEKTPVVLPSKLAAEEHNWKFLNDIVYAIPVAKGIYPDKFFMTLNHGTTADCSIKKE